MMLDNGEDSVVDEFTDGLADKPLVSAEETVEVEVIDSLEFRHTPHRLKKALSTKSNTGPEGSEFQQRKEKRGTKSTGG